LWDPKQGIYVNRFSNGTFSDRVTPTSFYALGAKAASDEEAEIMVQGWLMNKTRFCITPHGDMAGNSDSCYWGLPSIQASDPAYPPLGYWRGDLTMTLNLILTPTQALTLTFALMLI